MPEYRKFVENDYPHPVRQWISGQVIRHGGMAERGLRVYVKGENTLRVNESGRRVFSFALREKLFLFGIFQTDSVRINVCEIKRDKNMLRLKEKHYIWTLKICYITVVVKQQKREEIDLSAGLAEVWRVLTDRERTVLRNNSTIQHYRRNELIYCEGDEPKEMMCLLKGKVKIFKEGVGGRNQIIRMIKPVQYFGYRAYFAKEDYLTNASAFEASTVCMIPMVVVTDLLMKNVNLAMFFIRQLSLDLGIADSRTVNLTQKHIRGRLAESLLFLKESYGLEEDGATLSIYLSREDLANLSNMTTSNAIRTLSMFVSERIIAIDGRKIRIMDEEKLKKISRLG